MVWSSRRIQQLLPLLVLLTLAVHAAMFLLDRSEYASLERMREVVAKERMQVAADREEIFHELQRRQHLPTIFLITPTYKRLTQKADLTRMSHTLRLVPNVHWIVVEDSPVKTDLVAKFLSSVRGVEYSHLNAQTPPSMRRKICTKVNPRMGCNKVGEEEAMWLYARGVAQRNAGLARVREIFPKNGIVYFADDDNSYTLDVFEAMRETKRVSMWLVGLSGDMRYEGPVLTNGKVSKFLAGWRPDRPFPVDMAGFAINANEILSRPDLNFSFRAERGFLESEFLKQIVRRDEIEYKGEDCKCVMVWHTRTEKPNLKMEKVTRSDPSIEV